MATLSYSQQSANEKSIDELENDTLEWDKTLQNSTEELLFYKHLLTSEVLHQIDPDTIKKVVLYLEEIEDLKTEKIEVQFALRNHKNDLHGMLECEDISCEIFYQTQHQELLNRINELLSDYQLLQLKIFQLPFLEKNKLFNGKFNGYAKNNTN